MVKPDQDGLLIVRNRIYERVFNLDWIKAAIPVDSVRLWATRTAVAAVSLLLMSLVFWYEFIYPQPFINTLNKALEDYPVAESAYKDLRGIPLRQGWADKLWGQFNLRRMDRALDLDTLPNRGSDAYRLVNDAQEKLVELKTLPEYAAMGATKRSHFFEQRAIRSAYGEHREDALLWWLKALTALPESEKPRRAASHLIGADYARLEKTIRPRGAPFTSEVNPLGRIMTLSPDGRRLAIVYGVGIYLWDLHHPEDKPFVLPTAGDPVATLAFSGDGGRLAAASESSISVWDVARSSGKLLALRSGDPAVTALDLSRDGRWLAAGGGKHVRVWDLERPNAGPLYVGIPDDSVEALAIGSDGRRLAVVGEAGTKSDGLVRVWELDRLTAKPITLKAGQQGLVVKSLGLDFSPDGHRLAKVHQFCVYVWILDRPGDAPLTLLSPIWAIDLTFDLDGRRLAHGGNPLDVEGSAVRVWNLDRPSVGSLELRMPELNRGTAFDPDRRRLITAGIDRVSGIVVRVWDLDSPGAVPGASTMLSDLMPLVLSPDGSRAAGALINDMGRDRKVRALRVWDLDRPGSRPLVLQANLDDFRTCVFSPDGLRLAGAEKDTVRVWDLSRPDDKPIELRSPGQHYTAVAFSPDGRRLAGGSDGLIQIWDLDRPEAKGNVLRSPGGFTAMAFSPDGRRLAGSTGNLVRIWDLDHAGADPLALRSPEFSIDAIGFSADGRRLVGDDRLTMNSGKVAVWDLTRPVSEPPLSKSFGGLSVAASIGPRDDPTYLLVATPNWAHLRDSMGRTSCLTPAASYQAIFLPGQDPRFVSSIRPASTSRSSSIPIATRHRRSL